MTYENLLATIQSRRSVRQFTTQPVERADLLRILEAARWAPSNHNRQGWKFLVYENPEQIRALAHSVENGLTERIKLLPPMASSYASGMLRYATFFAEAPVLIVALHKRPASVALPLLEGLSNAALVSGEPLSTAMAVQNLLLAAQTLGLGSCILTGPLLVPEVLANLDLPPGYDVTCLVALGYAAEKPDPPRRKGVEQIVEFRNSLTNLGCSR